MRPARALRVAAVLAAATAVAGARFVPAALLRWTPWHDAPLAPQLAPPRLGAPAGAGSLSLTWDALQGANYTLLADDWWASRDAPSPPARVAYAGADTAAVLTDMIMPGAPVTLLLVAVDALTGVELARSDTAIFAASDAGACGNLADATVWRDNIEHLRPDVTDCLEACSLHGGDCTAKCVQQRDPFSSPCAACWGAYRDCAVAHCSVPCGWSPKSSKCHDCTEAACDGACVSCTGIPDWAAPKAAAATL